MEDRELLANRFEEHRPRLRALAYRMLGSQSESDDAMQEAWLRLDRSDSGGVENLGGWLTTVVGRVCLNMLRSRGSRRERLLSEPSNETPNVRMPDPIVDSEDGIDPEHQALLADGIGLALLVVLETLSPAARIAFVLHDTFGVPFDEIAPIVGRSPAATRQLASRARRRVQSGPKYLPPTPPVRGRSSMRSSPPRETAISGRCSQCWILTSCSGRTPVPQARRGRSTARTRWPSRREPSLGLASSRVGR